MRATSLRWTSALGGCVLGLAGCDPVVESERSVPGEATPAAILEFLDGRGYTGATWRAETGGPRDEVTAVSPHDRVQVFQNDTLVEAPPEVFPPDSMAVKVLYDGDEQVGHAVMWRVPGTTGFTYFCYGPVNRCGYAEQAHPREAPVFGTGLAFACGQCHGGQIFTEIEP